MSQVLSVSQVITQLKALIESDINLQNLQCVGEISNLSKTKSGHWYFALKDNQSKINCVMFYGQNLKLTFPVNEGDEVLISGNATVYTGSGQLQLIVNTMSLYGQGALYKKYLQMRDMLHKQGYFNQEHKKALPQYPMRIGVVVGAQSAAQADILKTLKMRWPIAEVLMFESLVQGNQAPQQLIERLKEVDEKNCDVILLARGGGSLEDLWAFNDIELAMTVFNLNTPIITGVGHEVDITLVDYMADRRGLTPTDAAIQATPNQFEVLNRLATVDSILINKISQNIKHSRLMLENLFKQSLLARPTLLIAQHQFKHKEFSDRILSQTHRFQRLMSSFDTTVNQLLNNIKQRSFKLNNSIVSHTHQLQQKMSKKLEFNLTKQQLMQQQLNLLSPLSLLEKGYLISYQNDKLIRLKSEINQSQPIRLRYKDGDMEVMPNGKHKV